MSFDAERSSTNGNESPELDVVSPWGAPVGNEQRKAEVVLVTGSSGFLGQHIVKLLQEEDQTVREIRLFDIVPYENKLGHKTDKPTKEITGDLCNARALQEAFAGVDCVIHAAARVDVGLFPDVEALEAVNVEGTRNVIDACIKQNVPYLVFTSTVDVVVSSNHIFFGAENTTFTPKHFLMGPYAETKHRAEQLVLQANHRVLADGATKFRTLVLRPTAMFGEQDTHFVVEFLRHAKASNNCLSKVRSVDERFQVTYVGNAAQAHLQAKNRLATDDSVAGEVFFVTDDTPLEDIYEFLRPFVECQGCRLSDYTIPYLLAVLLLWLWALALRMLRPVWHSSCAPPPASSVTYICTSLFFNRTKATLRLGYYPSISPDDAVSRSLDYYKSLKF
ncbi:3 beta-hydroxysteroid dehydrogenase type 7-like isoform X2 [Ornithodoros turicata]|uniref:Putative 3 hydroxysteroid dehydrogenase n=2 Tax=Ornithodoros turicata TaxID=34597 RepID=A0A2R5L6B2_9ACAR